MMKSSRCLMAAALAVGISAFSFGATTSVPKPDGLVDLTDDDASRVTTTSTGEWLKGPGTAFHNKGADNKNTDFRVIKNATALDFIYTFDAATCVNGYAFCMFNNGMPNRAPLKWNIYGSNDYDASSQTCTWTLLDSRENETAWGVTEYRYFAFGNGAAYKSYKVDILSPQEGHDNYIQFNFMEFFFDASAVVPAFGECTFVSDQDGEYVLSGVIAENAPTSLSLVLTPEDGGDAKQIALDTPEVGVPFARTVSATDEGLSTTVWYSAKLVAVNENGSSEKALGRCWFGPSPRPVLYAKKIEFSVSEEIAETLVDATLTDFPVLVRLSAAAIDGFDPADFLLAGRDLYFADDGGNGLSFEVDKFDPDGETLVWVKIPSLSASTKFICYYGGPDNFLNDPTDVWTGYLGVWHYNGQEDGVTPNATANAGLDGSSGQFTPLSGEDTPFGSAAMQAVKTVDVNDYEPTYKVGKQFSVSGWFKVPAQNSSTYSTFVTKKAGLSWDATTGWYLEMSQSKTKMTLVPSSGSTAAYTSVPDVTANWNYFTIIHDNGSTKVYLNGGTSPVISQTSAINVSSTMFKMLASGQQGDEYRLSKSNWSALRASVEYKSMKNADFLSNSGSSAMDPTAPVFEQPTLVRNGDGSFTFTTRLLGGEGTVYAQFSDGVNTVTQELTTADTVCPKTYSAVAVGLTAGTTYTYSAYGVNDNGTTVKMSGGIFHNGTLSVVKTADADENGLVPGVVVFSRESPGLKFSVPYAIGGTAEAGLVYETLPGVVTIPAGESSVEVQVKPLICSAVREATTVTLMIEPGLYGVSGAAGAAEVTIADLPPEAGYNTWTAQVDGKASTPGNWSEGRAPTEGDHVLFDGRFTVAPCEWDKDAPHTVASWTQREDFTGAVTVDTTFAAYSADFTNLVVTGDVAINGGTLQQKTHGTATTPQYRLMMTVGGDFTVGAAGTVSVAGLGRFSNQSPWGGSAAHGGDNVSGATAQYNASDPAYGDILAPMAVAHGSQCGTDSNDKKSHGGGALYLVVAGDFTNAGVVTADGEGHYSACGAGGSIYIVAANIYGAGKYTSSVPAMGKTDGTGAVGSGGRIALVARGVNEAADISCTGRYEGWGRRGAAGTVYLKGNAVNEVRVKNSEQQSWNMIQTTTPIPASDDTMNWKSCARSINLVGDWCAHLRLTQPLVKMSSLSLLSEASNRKNGNTVYFRQSDLDLAGKILQVKSVIIDGVDFRLPVGDYTLEDAESQGWTWLKDSSYKAAVEDNPDTLDVDESSAEVPGTGILRVLRDGLTIFFR